MSQAYPIHTATTNAIEPTIQIFTMKGRMKRSQRVVWDSRHGQRSHDHVLSGNQDIAEAITELEGQDRHLPAHAHKVGQGRHDRHGDIGLTGSRGDEEVGEALNEEHPDGGKGPRKP